MNLAWDAFRIIENHSKSMIFMMPDDPKNEEYATYIKAVTKPINIDAIRVTSHLTHKIFALEQIESKILSDI